MDSDLALAIRSAKMSREAEAILVGLIEKYGRAEYARGRQSVTDEEAEEDAKWHI